MTYDKLPSAATKWLPLSRFVQAEEALGSAAQARGPLLVAAYELLLLLGHIFSGWNILVDLWEFWPLPEPLGGSAALDGSPLPPAHGAHSLPRHRLPRKASS